MQIHNDSSGDIQIVRIEGDLDGQTSPSAQSTLLELIAAGNHQLLVDFSRLQFISSAGLRVLLVMAKEVQRRGGQLRICNAGASVLEVLEMSGFDTVIPVLPTEAEALQSFQA